MKSCVRKIHWRREGLPTPVFLGFPCSSAGKESTCNARYPSSICELGRSRGEEKGYPLQYSGLENSMDCIVHEVAKSRTRLRDFHITIKQYQMAWASKVALVVKNPPDNVVDTRDTGSIPGLGRSPGGHGNPLQYSCLENPMDRGAWQAAVHRVAKSQTRLRWQHVPDDTISVTNQYLAETNHN